jgi:hypothetical protein
MATSQNQATGAKNYANEPGNNAASFLYDPSSLSQVKMRIIGDPAWMQQGEAGLGVSAATFDFSPFNPDGGINYDSQAVMFSMAFNTPQDYDFNTGLVNVNANSRNGQPQEYYTFTATKCKNIFSKGKFEQEIEGKLLIEKKNTGPANGRATKPNTVTTATASRERTTAQDEAQDLENGKNAGTGTATTKAKSSASTTTISSVGEIEYDINGNPISSNATPLPKPAPPPKPATSTGTIASVSEVEYDILGNPISSGFAPSSNKVTTARAGVNKPPQIIAKDE